MISNFDTDNLHFYNCNIKALEFLKKLYFLEIENLKMISQKKLPAIALETMVYPSLIVKIDSIIYSDAISRFDLFENYYQEELIRICSIFSTSKISFAITKSKEPISLALVDEDLANNLTQEQMAFRKINILSIEEVEKSNSYEQKLNWFHPTRVDYSINRLKHYTNISAQYFQDYIIFTNYQKYLPYFIEYAKQEIANGNFQDLIGPNDTSLVKNNMEPYIHWNDSITLPQMPTYHLIKSDKSGISLVNIGVGASNVKTMADHLSVLRPKFVLMLGHCGGLSLNHSIGDYIFGDAHIMINFDDISCDSVSYASYYNEMKDLLCNSKNNIHVGPIISVCDRNWELQAKKMCERFKNFHAIGVDMEAAMMIKIFNQSMIPSGSMLCISDRPMHKEIRLAKMAQNFYSDKLKSHLLDALQIMNQMHNVVKCTMLKDNFPLFR